MLPSALPDHQIPFGAPGWAVWRRNGLRSAGFPAEAVLPLGSPALDNAVERALDAETALETALATARAALDAAFDGAEVDPRQRQRLRKARRGLAQGKTQALAELGLEAQATLLAAAHQTLEQTRAELAAVFETALAEQAEAIHAAARDPLFREAVLWQNRAAFHTGVEPVASRPPAVAKRDNDRRYAEKMVASYLQRYAVKNDTIGFFGPSVPIGFVDHGPALAVRPGRRLIAASRVYFEAWCLEELARPFARQELLRPWLRPHRNPLARLESTWVLLPGRAPKNLPAAQAAVFAACDGQATAREIAAALLANPGLGLADPKDVYAVLDQLVRQELVTWGFGLPSTPAAAEVFAAQIAALGHPKLRAVGQHALDAIDRARQEVAACLGDPVALDPALAKLEATFQRLTGTAPTRRAGQVYGGRTLVYLDCVRDVEVACGPELRAAIATPLGVVLDAVRWFSHEIAVAARQVFTATFGTLAGPGKAVEGLVFSPVVEQRLSDPGFLEPIQRRLVERWDALLGARPDQRRVAVSSAEIGARAAELFACPGAGWPQARCHSPDVMIAAASAEAVAAGEYQLVLGEVHAGINTLNSWAFLGVWPEREAFFRQIDLDVPEPRFLMTGGKDKERITTRTVQPYCPPQELVVLADPDPSLRVPGQDVPAAELVIEQASGRLIVRTRDGRHRIDAMAGFGSVLSRLATSGFSFLPEDRHWPRITLDRLVLHRETWRLPAAELMDDERGFAGQKDGAGRFLAARRWARGLGLPRFVFVKSPLERKPIYTDLASPIYVDLLARLARRTAEASTPEQTLALSLSEMLPGPDELWLPDAQDRRYCAELRLVVIDKRPLAEVF